MQPQCCKCKRKKIKVSSWVHNIFRSTRPEVSYKKRVLKNLAKFAVNFAIFFKNIYFAQLFWAAATQHIQRKWIYWSNDVFLHLYLWSNFTHQRQQFVGILQNSYPIKALTTIVCVFLRTFPASIYLLKVNSRNTRVRYEIYSKLTIKIQEASFWYFYC